MPAPVPPSHPPLLRVPPFPRAKRASFGNGSGSLTDREADELIEKLRTLKAGGTFWGSQPELPPSYILVRVADEGIRSDLLRKHAGNPLVCWVDGREAAGGDAEVVSGCCDPWHLLDRASALVVDAADELALIGALSGIPMTTTGSGAFAGLENPSRGALRMALQAHVPATLVNPFTSEPIRAAEAAELCGFWRALIDSNRSIAAAVGFAFWKRETVAPLLWAGAGGVPFCSAARGIAIGDLVAIWRARTAARLIRELEEAGVDLVEVEDGFIRSAGLGADCVPPLSIVVDRLGSHFDPARPSELEELLQNGAFSAGLVDRARVLRQLIVSSGLSKYSSGGEPLKRRVDGRRHILVTGQVEDDRAVVAGGQGLTSNFELLERARETAPDAYILYKPHPDVEAGHRIGAIPDDRALSVADEIVRDAPISAVIDMVDEVQVNTSLAGFEALLREKAVTTHGVPFYAGWGLTRDLGPVPARRTARRSIDELVAGVLLVYPRYLDPETGLPCPPEVLIRRLSESGGTPQDGFVVRLRRFQGRVKRRLSQLGATR